MLLILTESPGGKIFITAIYQSGIQVFEKSGDQLRALAAHPFTIDPAHAFVYVKDEKPMLLGYDNNQRFVLVDGTAPAGQMVRQWPFAESFHKLFPFITSQGDLLAAVPCDRPGGLGIKIFGTPIQDPD